MIRNLIARLKYFLLVGFHFAFLLSLPAYAFAQEKKEAEGVDWTLGIGLYFLFIILASVLVMRSSKRRDSAMTDDELMAEREAELKKELGREH